MAMINVNTDFDVKLYIFFELPDRKGKMGVLFSYMDALLS